MSKRRSGSAAGLIGARTQVITEKLANGLTMVLCPREQLSQSYAAVYFGVGSRHESRRDNGITHVLEHMLFRGTKSFGDATTLNAAAEDFGGFLEGATYRDHLVFATGCHPSAVDDAVAILGELVQTPRYRAMDVEKSILREELLEGLDQDGRMIDLDNVTHTTVFGDHGLGMPIEGDLATLERLGRADLEAHRRQFLVGNNAVVCVAGPIDVDKTAKQVRAAFGRMPAGAAPVVTPPSMGAAAPRLKKVSDPGSQVELRLAFRGVPVQDPQYPGLVLLARVLADGLASRLNAELIDRRGLAYALSAGLTTYSDCGLFDFEVAVAPDKVAEAVGALLGFAKSAERLRFSRDEIERSRRRYRYGLEFMGDSASDLASWHGRAALFNITTEMAQLGASIERATVAELHAAARRVFQPAGLVITAVGELGRREWQGLQREVERWDGRPLKSI